MRNTIKSIIAVGILVPIFVYAWKIYEKHETLTNKIEALEYMTRTGHNYIEVEYLGHDYGYKMTTINTKFKIKSIRPDGKHDYGDLTKVGDVFYYRSLIHPTYLHWENQITTN